MRRASRVLAVYVSLTSAAASQNDFWAEWASVPPEKASLVLQIADMQDRHLLVYDGLGDKLDVVGWDSKLPLLKKYILSAGDYQIKLPDSDAFSAQTVNVELRPGTTSFLVLQPGEGVPGRVAISSWKVGSEEASQALKHWKELGYLPGEVAVAKPTEIGPKDNTIALNTDPPFAIPPPPK